MFKRSQLRGLVVLVSVLVFAVIGYLVLHDSKAATSADINNDTKIDINDLTILAANYGTSGKTFSQGDITGDGTVNIYDFSILAAQWGNSTQTGVNKARPFAANSPWNTPLRGGPLDSSSAAPTWIDNSVLHGRSYIIGPNSLYRRDTTFHYWGNASSPVLWKFVMPANYSGNNTTYNRYNDLWLKQERGPANMVELAQPDHTIILAREDSGRYLGIWNGFADTQKQIVTAHPYSGNNGAWQGQLTAGQATATTLSNVSGASVGSWVGASGAKWAHVTGGTSSAPTFTGWVYSDGSAAPTPAQYDQWFVSPNVGTATSIAATSLTDTTKSLGTNALAENTRGQRLIFCGNAFAIVTSNSSNVITFTAGWQDFTSGAAVATPANGCIYYVTGDLPNGSWTPSSSFEGNALTGTGMGYNLTSPPVAAGYSGPNTAGGRAANFADFAGLITSFDRTGPRIDHALLMMGDATSLSSTLRTAPATSPLGGGGGGPLGMGYRIGIPNTPTNVAVRSSLTTESGRRIYDCLMNYGAFMGDVAGGYPMFFVIDSTSETIDWDTYWALFYEHGGGDDWAKIAPLLRYTTDFP